MYFTPQKLKYFVFYLYLSHMCYYCSLELSIQSTNGSIHFDLHDIFIKYDSATLTISS